MAPNALTSSSPTATAAGELLSRLSYRCVPVPDHRLTAVLRRCLGLAAAALAAIGYGRSGIVCLVLAPGLGLMFHEVSSTRRAWGSTRCTGAVTGSD